MRRGRIPGVVVAAALLWPVPAAASPPEPPDVDVTCFGDLKPCGEPVALGEPRWEPGKVLISGYSSGVGPCFVYSHSGGGSGTCGVTGPRRRDAIQINGLNWSVRQNRTFEYTELAGALSTDVARVRVRYRAEGESHALDAFTYQMTDDVQRKLKAPKPFGIFEVSVKGCVVASHFRATAYGADGSRLATTRLAKLRGNCRNPTPGTGGYIFFGRKSRPVPPSGLSQSGMLDSGSLLAWSADGDVG